jgi:hypothetical protein
MALQPTTAMAAYPMVGVVGVEVLGDLRDVVKRANHVATALRRRQRRRAVVLDAGDGGDEGDVDIPDAKSGIPSNEWPHAPPQKLPKCRYFT